MLINIIVSTQAFVIMRQCIRGRSKELKRQNTICRRCALICAYH